MSTLQRTFILISIALSMVLIYLLQPILMPFLVGMLIAYLGDPLVDRLELMGTNRTLGVCIVFIFFMVLLVSGLLVLVPVVVRELSALIREIPGFIVVLQETASPYMVEWFDIDPFAVNLDELTASLSQNWKQAGGYAGRLIKEITQSSMVLMAWVANLALIPVVAFYLMRDWDDLMARLRSLLPRDVEDTAVSLVMECDEVLSSFLRGQLLIMFLLGCIYAVGLIFVGLDTAVLIGLMAGLASIVPYLGFIVGILAASIAAAFQFQDMIHLVYIAIVFGIGQLLEGMVLTPLLVGDRIGLHPVAVIFAVLAGAQLFGFVGVLLALPVAAVLMVFLRHLHNRYKASSYYGSTEPLE